MDLLNQGLSHGLDLFSRVKDKIDQSRGTELEKKVKEATSFENWGASSSLKEEIARATFKYDGFQEVMSTLWNRLSESGKNWRIVFKSLELLEYLLRNGSTRVIDESRDRLYQIRTLVDFSVKDIDGKEKGQGIREKAKFIVELLNDETKLERERESAARFREKSGPGKMGSITSTGFGSDEYGFREKYVDSVQRERLEKKKSISNEDKMQKSKEVKKKKKSSKKKGKKIATDEKVGTEHESSNANEQDENEWADFESAPNIEEKELSARVENPIDDVDFLQSMSTPPIAHQTEKQNSTTGDLLDLFSGGIVPTVNKSVDQDLFGDFEAAVDNRVENYPSQELFSSVLENSAPLFEIQQTKAVQEAVSHSDEKEPRKVKQDLGNNNGQSNDLWGNSDLVNLSDLTLTNKPKASKKQSSSSSSRGVSMKAMNGPSNMLGNNQLNLTSQVPPQMPLASSQMVGGYSYGTAASNYGYPYAASVPVAGVYGAQGTMSNSANRAYFPSGQISENQNSDQKNSLDSLFQF